MKPITNHSIIHNVSTSKVNVEKLISDQDYRIYELVNYSIITSSISMFGVLANVMNIIVFCKQGFTNTMDISLLGLAIADLCGLITLLLCTIFISPLLTNLGARIASSEMQHLIAGIPHICFIRITSWITVFITAERCLCITLPLKIKQLITRRRTTAIVCAIYILIMLSFEPEYETAYYGWKFDKKQNKTLFGLLFTSNRKNVEGVTYIIYAILGIVSFLAVIVFTLILVIQLNKKSKWRRSAANVQKSRSESISNRDRKTMTMVVMIAVVLIVCYTPGIAVSITTFLELELSVIGRYSNAYFMCWSFVVIFESVNSSVNIFLYYHMSSKYRETFRLVFSCWRPTLSNSSHQSVDSCSERF